jgi:hypothetical protein
MSIKARIIDAIIFLVGTLLSKKAFPKLTENAVSGWIDDKIGELLGWSSPDVSTVLSWVWAAIVVALVLLGYHVLYNRFVRSPSGSQQSSGDRFYAARIVGGSPPRTWIKRVEPLHLTVFGLVLALVGVGWHLYRTGGSFSAMQNISTAQKVTLTANKIPAPPPEVVAAIKAPLESKIAALQRQVASLPGNTVQKRSYDSNYPGVARLLCRKN